MKKSSVNRSPLFYVGDKYKLIAEIRTHFPTTIRKFVEPFVGGGSVYLNVDADEYLLNDIDADVVNLHRMLLSYVGREGEFLEKVLKLVDRFGLSCSFREDSVPDELKKRYVKTYFAEYNRSGFMRLRDEYNSNHRGDYLMLYVLLIYGFNRMIRFNKQGKYNLPVGNVDFNQNTADALTDYFRLNAKKATCWQTMDFQEFLGNISLTESDLVYLDPPYLITFSEYNKLWNDASERRLLKLLDQLAANSIKFAISNVTHYKGKVNETFLEWSEKYVTHSIKSNYISYHDNSIKTFREVLVTNY